MYKLFAIVLLVGSHFVTAQHRSPIVVLTRYSHDGMILRWAPATAETWLEGNQHGYVIERMTLKDDGDIVENSSVKLTTTPITPLNEQEIGLLSATSREAAVVGEILHANRREGPRPANPYSLLNNNRQLENRFGVAMLMCDISATAARAGGLRFVDGSAIPGARYVYRISVDNTNIAGVAITTAKDTPPHTKINDLLANFRDKQVSICWSALLHKGVYTAYYIERSTDGKNFIRLSELPYVHMTERDASSSVCYVDSLTVNGKEFFYRIQGLDPFGELGPYSNVVAGKGKENLNGQLILRDATIKDGYAKLKWEFPESSERFVARFVVACSSNHDGVFHDLPAMLDKRVRDYVDQIRFSNSYYIVRALDEHGSEIARSLSYLVQQPDEIAPAVPSGLQSKIVQTVASLSWNANMEDDLLGYRVFRMNTLREQPTEVTTDILTVAAFTDSLLADVLNREVYYCVIAVDRNYNTSEYSPPLRLLRPDSHPPAAPVFTRVELASDTLFLEWTNSASTDILKTELQKIDVVNRLTRTIATWARDNERTSFSDHRLVATETYQYRIVVYDSSGNTSMATTAVFTYEPGIRPSVKQFTGNANRTERVISLTWKNPSEATACIVYRKKNNEPFVLYQRLKGNAESFSDTQLAISNRYSYKVQPIFEGGVRGVISEVLTMTY